MAVTKKKSAPKKAAVRKAVKKRAKRKAPTKKAAARKVTKKRVKKKATAKKAAPRIKPSRATMDSHSLFTEVPISRSFKNINDAIEKTSRGSSMKYVAPPATTIDENKSKKSTYIAVVTVFLTLSFGGYLLANNASIFKNENNDVVTETEVSKPALKPLSTSFTYTSTGIRLTWDIKEVDVKSILISSAEDGKTFTELKTLPSDTRFLNITKTDTTGLTKFQVTTATTKGERFSSTVELRGRFTV
jgi:hypothetical protein